jgi:hypothetical protein
MIVLHKFLVKMQEPENINAPTRGISSHCAGSISDNLLNSAPVSQARLLCLQRGDVIEFRNAQEFLVSSHRKLR